MGEKRKIYAFKALPVFGHASLCAAASLFCLLLSVGGCAGVATNVASRNTPSPVLSAPSITSQPANQSVTAGQIANFSVVATGTAPLTYQWQKNGAALAGATSSSYTTATTTTSDTGAQFRVVVSNSAGSATSRPATLTVNAPVVAPAITAQPVSQTITAGQAASFSVAATGTAPLSYQWNENGMAISGAIFSTYTTPATNASNNGMQFRVVVSNSAGTVTSSAATLTVNAAALAPTVTTQPADQTVAAGQVAWRLRCRQVGVPVAADLAPRRAR